MSASLFRAIKIACALIPIVRKLGARGARLSDRYKCTNGIKRHLAVDTLGLPFFTYCTRANVTDDQGLIEMFSRNLDYFRAKPVNIPKIAILLAHDYHLDTIQSAVQALDLT